MTTTKTWRDFSYDAWITEQAELIASAVNRYALGGIHSAVIYVSPSKGPQAGKLVASLEKPEGATDIVRFPSVGDRVMAVPRSALHSLLWHACRSFPICPTE